MIPRRVDGLTDMDPIPDIPDEAAQAGLDTLLLALAMGPRITVDPYATAKACNLDRLIFGKMPVLCGGPTGLHTILTPAETGGLIVLGGVDE
jgi:hypothetical protein